MSSYVFPCYIIFKAITVPTFHLTIKYFLLGNNKIFILLIRKTKFLLESMFYNGYFMLNKEQVQNLSNKIKYIIKDSPISDMENNINALLQSTFTKMDLINREEFDVQAEVLKRTRSKLETLEAKIIDLEHKLK